eukprot:2928333-Prymnesium_polylepis.1
MKPEAVTLTEQRNAPTRNRRNFTQGGPAAQTSALITIIHWGHEFEDRPGAKCSSKARASPGPSRSRPAHTLLSERVQARSTPLRCRLTAQGYLLGRRPAETGRPLQ